MFQVNKNNGDMKMSKKLTDGYVEITEEQYNRLKTLDPAQRALIFNGVPNEDGKFDNLEAKNFKVTTGGNAFSSDGDQNATNGSYLGVNPLTATRTFNLDAPTGNIDTIGKVTTVDFEATGTSKAKSQKGNQSAIATLEDLSSATVNITSPKSTLDIGSAGTSVTLDVKIATAVKAGIALFPIGGGLTIDAAGNVRLDGAIAPFKYIDIWDASTNTPKLSDATGVPETFYITHVPGTQNLGSGNIIFAVGDWVLCQEDIGGKPKYQKVPMSEVLGAITANMIKAGTIGHGVAIDTDQTIKTTGAMQATTATFTTLIVTGSIQGQR